MTEQRRYASAKYGPAGWYATQSGWRTEKSIEPIERPELQVTSETKQVNTEIPTEQPITPAKSSVGRKPKVW